MIYWFPHPALILVKYSCRCTIFPHYSHIIIFFTYLYPSRIYQSRPAFFKNPALFLISSRILSINTVIFILSCTHPVFIPHLFPHSLTQNTIYNYPNSPIFILNSSSIDSALTLFWSRINPALFPHLIPHSLFNLSKNYNKLNSNIFILNLFHLNPILIPH